MFLFLKNLKTSWVINQKIKNNWNENFSGYNFLRCRLSFIKLLFALLNPYTPYISLILSPLVSFFSSKPINQLPFSILSALKSTETTSRSLFRPLLPFLSGVRFSALTTVVTVSLSVYFWGKQSKTKCRFKCLIKYQKHLWRDSY